MLDEGGFKHKIKNTTKTNKIKDLLDKTNVKIFVGFPSGRTHVAAKHNVSQKGKRKGGADTGKNAQGATLEAAELAKQLHYGSALIPARPFLDDGIKFDEEKIKAAIAEQIQKIKEGQKPNWDKVGTMAVGAIQEFVRSDYYKGSVPNSETTIKIKGSDTPLIDGGDLINSMSYVVVGGDK